MKEPLKQPSQLNTPTTENHVMETPHLPLLNPLSRHKVGKSLHVRNDAGAPMSGRRSKDYFMLSSTIAQSIYSKQKKTVGFFDTVISVDRKKDSFQGMKQRARDYQTIENNIQHQPRDKVIKPALVISGGVKPRNKSERDPLFK